MTDPELITLKMAAALLGYGGANPASGVAHLIDRGRLEAVVADDDTPLPNSGHYRTTQPVRLVRRADVLRLRDELAARAQRQAERFAGLGTGVD